LRNQNNPKALRLHLGLPDVQGAKFFGVCDITRHITTSLDYSMTGGKNGNDDKIGIPQASLVTLNLAYNF
jgi:hypothetical protein